MSKDDQGRARTKEFEGSSPQSLIVTFEHRETAYLNCAEKTASTARSSAGQTVEDSDTDWIYDQGRDVLAILQIDS